VAGARIEDCIRSAFYGETPLRANEKQVALAAKFGYDVKDCTCRVAHAIVADLMEQLDRETMVAEGLAPGVTVTNIHDKSRQYHVISSIQPNLLVYFKGRHRRKAYARNLRRVAAPPNSRQEPPATASRVFG
jgi:hypothetical protein